MDLSGDSIVTAKRVDAMQDDAASAQLTKSIDQNEDHRDHEPMSTTKRLLANPDLKTRDINHKETALVSESITRSPIDIAMTSKPPISNDLKRDVQIKFKRCKHGRIIVKSSTKKKARSPDNERQVRESGDIIVKPQDLADNKNEKRIGVENGCQSKEPLASNANLDSIESRLSGTLNDAQRIADQSAEYSRSPENLSDRSYNRRESPAGHDNRSRFEKTRSRSSRRRDRKRRKRGGRDRRAQRLRRSRRSSSPLDLSNHPSESEKDRTYSVSPRRERHKRSRTPTVMKRQRYDRSCSRSPDVRSGRSDRGRKRSRSPGCDRSRSHSRSRDRGDYNDRIRSYSRSHDRSHSHSHRDTSRRRSSSRGASGNRSPERYRPSDRRRRSRYDGDIARDVSLSPRRKHSSSPAKSLGELCKASGKTMMAKTEVEPKPDEQVQSMKAESLTESSGELAQQVDVSKTHEQVTQAEANKIVDSIVTPEAPQQQASDQGGDPGDPDSPRDGSPAGSSYSPSYSDSPNSDIYDPEEPILMISPVDSPPIIKKKDLSNNNDKGHHPKPVAKPIKDSTSAYFENPDKNDDDVPSSAVQLNHKEKYIQKLNRQARVIEEVKVALKPHYQKRDISKDQYKEVLRKAVPKICHSKDGEINPVKISSLVSAYVKKMKKKLDRQSR